MHLQEKKLGRNDACVCGSGKKYKKCCLNRSAALEDEEEVKRLKTFVEKVKERYSDKTITFSRQGEVSVKMSEVILDYADELLNAAKTYEEQKHIIILCITAWNFSLLEKSEMEEQIDRFLDFFNLERGSYKWETMANTIKILINKRHINYPFIKIFIIDFEFIKIKNGFHLNIVSALPP